MTTGTESVQSEVMETPAVVEQEKLLPQSQVNDLVGDAKHKGYQKGYQQALTEAQSKSTQLGGMTSAPSSSEEQTRRIFEEEYNKRQQALSEQHAQAQIQKDTEKLFSSLANKVKEAEPRYSDFHEVTNAVEWGRYSHLLPVIDEVDNSGDVFYELSNNLGKLGALSGLGPQEAKIEMRKLSNSIKQNLNRTASSAPEPLRQTKPSHVGLGAGASGNASPEDRLRAFKSQFKG